MKHTHVHYGLDAQYRLPVNIQENGDPEFVLPYSDPTWQVDEVGYVIARNIIPPELCDAVIAAFLKEVKPYKGPLYRQISMTHVPHKFRNGYMTNAFLAIQDFTSFPEFRTHAIDVIASLAVQNVVAKATGYKPQLVESTFWESSLMGTPLHCDGDYINSIVRQVLLGGWFALEDIHPEAGRFLVVPRSHHEDAWGPAGAIYRDYRERDKAATGRLRDDLKQRLEQGAILHKALLKSPLSIIAPVLNKGDAIFWDSKIIHGTLPPVAKERTRYSLAGHYIPDDDALVMHGRYIEYETQMHHGMRLRANAYPGDSGE